MRLGFNPEKDKVKKVDDFFHQVIIPVYIPNHEGYFKDSFKILKYSLESLIKTSHSKSYTNIEILVIDDGSRDNYAEAICNKYSNCTYFYKENGRLSSARDYGINLSKGEYIAFLDDDDFWESLKIENR